MYEAYLGRCEEACMARETSWLKDDVEILARLGDEVDFVFVGVGD